MSNVDEHYVVVGVVELWEESLEVNTRNRIKFLCQMIFLRNESLMWHKKFAPNNQPCIWQNCVNIKGIQKLQEG